MCVFGQEDCLAKQWNELNVLKEAKKFPMQGFSDIQVDK
jgi:hypothetical protein